MEGKLIGVSAASCGAGARRARGDRAGRRGGERVRRRLAAEQALVARPGAFAEAAPVLRSRRDGRESPGERGGVAGRDMPAGLAVGHDLGQPADGGDERRAAEAHRLDGGAPEQFRQFRRRDDDVGPGVDRPRVGDERLDADNSGKARRRDVLAQPRLQRRILERPADHAHGNPRADLLGQARQGVDQHVLPLDAVDAAEKRDAQRALAVVGRRRRVGRSVEAVVDDVAGPLSRRRETVAGGARIEDEPRAAPERKAPQRRARGAGGDLVNVQQRLAGKEARGELIVEHDRGVDIDEIGARDPARGAQERERQGEPSRQRETRERLAP